MYSKSLSQKRRNKSKRRNERLVKKLKQMAEQEKQEELRHTNPTPLEVGHIVLPNESIPDDPNPDAHCHHWTIYPDGSAKLVSFQRKYL
jgi:hypothetical protein